MANIESSVLNTWYKDLKVEICLLILILILAALFRFYRLSEYMQFLGDQGRDALVIQGIIINHHLPAIGPPSSVGTIYLGPFYYYLMAIVMSVFYLNPVAASGMVALLGVGAVLLIYYLGREWFGGKAGLVSAFLFAISPVLINYSKFSWNPNSIPFFVLLAFLGIFKAHKSGNFYFFILVAFSLAALFQLHYLTLILLPIFVLLWGNEWRRRKDLRKFWKGTFLGIGLFLLMMLPLILFDLKNNFMNFHGLINLFMGDNTGVNLSLTGSFSRLPTIFINDYLGRYLTGQNNYLAEVVAILIFIPIIRRWYIYWKEKKMSWVILCLSMWLILGFFGLMFYKGPIYDHYLLFLSPIPFLLVGALAEYDLNLKGFKYFKLITLTFFLAVLTFFNLSINPLLTPPNNQLQKTVKIDQFIISKTNNQPFNFALLAENNYDSAYQFYFNRLGQPSKKVPFEKANQLFVVCEDPICQPVGNKKYEIAAFGWAIQEWEQDLEGIKIFKLRPNPAQPSR